MSLKKSWNTFIKWTKGIMPDQKDKPISTLQEDRKAKWTTLTFQVSKVPDQYVKSIKNILINNVWVIPSKMDIQLLKKEEYFTLIVTFKSIGNAHTSEIHAEISALIS